MQGVGNAIVYVINEGWNLPSEGTSDPQSLNEEIGNAKEPSETFVVNAVITTMENDK